MSRRCLKDSDILDGFTEVQFIFIRFSYFDTAGWVPGPQVTCSGCPQRLLFGEDPAQFRLISEQKAGWTKTECEHLQTSLFSAVGN